jgi:protein disulfide-isomerase A6
MKADWDKLGDKYASSATVMIVDADCTAEAQGTCGKEGVKGYPTIKYYMAGERKGRDYQQGRDYSSLDNFVKSKLDIAKCDAATGKGCMDIEKKFIAANKDKSRAELDALLATKEEDAKTRKAEKKLAEKEFNKKKKEWRKQDKMFSMAKNIITQLQKTAKSGGNDEL